MTSSDISSQVASWDVVLTIVYPIWDRIYYSQLFIGSKNKLVQCTESQLLMCFQEV